MGVGGESHNKLVICDVLNLLTLIAQYLVLAPWIYLLVRVQQYIIFISAAVIATLRSNPQGVAIMNPSLEPLQQPFGRLPKTREIQKGVAITSSS